MLNHRGHHDYSPPVLQLRYATSHLPISSMSVDRRPPDPHEHVPDSRCVRTSSMNCWKHESVDLSFFSSVPAIAMETIDAHLEMSRSTVHGHSDV